MQANTKNYKKKDSLIKVIKFSNYEFNGIYVSIQNINFWHCSFITDDTQVGGSANADVHVAAIEDSTSSSQTALSQAQIGGSFDPNIFVDKITDIVIHTDSNINKMSYCEFGYSYQHQDYLKDTDEAEKILAGSYVFETVDIEVFTKSNVYWSFCIIKFNKKHFLK